MAASDIILPQSTVGKIVAPTLENHTISKEGKAALQRAAAVFILHLSSAAADVARDSKRSTVNDKDIIAALADVDLAELVPSVKSSLAVWKTKASQANEAKKARLTTAAATEPAGTEDQPADS